MAATRRARRRRLAARIAAMARSTGTAAARRARRRRLAAERGGGRGGEGKSGGGIASEGCATGCGASSREGCATGSRASSSKGGAASGASSEEGCATGFGAATPSQKGNPYHPDRWVRVGIGKQIPVRMGAELFKKLKRIYPAAHHEDYLKEGSRWNKELLYIDLELIRAYRSECSRSSDTVDLVSSEDDEIWV